MCIGIKLGQPTKVQQLQCLRSRHWQPCFSEASNYVIGHVLAATLCNLAVQQTSSTFVSKAPELENLLLTRIERCLHRSSVWMLRILAATYLLTLNKVFEDNDA